MSSTDLKIQLKRKDEEIDQLKSLLAEKEDELEKLRVLVDQYKSVLEPVSGATGPRQRGVGISAEPQAKNIEQRPLQVHNKSESVAKNLRDAVRCNEFMSRYDDLLISQMVDCMRPETREADEVIIKEGTFGDNLYVLQEGQVLVTNNKKLERKMSAGKVFGELAILYNCKRTASIKAITNCKLWAIDRLNFQSIMMKTGMKRREEYIKFLKSIPQFHNRKEETLGSIADVLEEVHFERDEYIIRQGAVGDTFYIIAKGQVLVTKNDNNNDEPDFKPKFLKRGDYFGERALEREETRSANVIVTDPKGVDCLQLERDAYKQIISHIISPTVPRLRSLESDSPASLIGIQLSKLNFITTLGVGGFGRVDLVCIGKDKAKTFALKKLKKQHIVDTRQEEHILNEKRIMQKARCDFIVRLYTTFKDAKYLYMLLEVCLGGELWSLLRDKSHFDDSMTRFYTACVCEALIYLHGLGIVYRDLKPENLLLDTSGFIKLVDFGFAKEIGHGRKTWTFCGTPEYVAPEIILNRGHDLSCDLWSLGILMFELLTGNPPFSGADPMKTYNIILRGIDAIDFPRRITRHAQNLIKKLCRDNPTERLGYGRGGIKDIQKHKWFDGFNWEGLRRRTLKPPYVPKVMNSSDASNFDEYPPATEPEPPDDSSGWDKDF